MGLGWRGFQLGKKPLYLRAAGPPAAPTLENEPKKLGLR
jgi:hypothetical protein